MTTPQRERGYRAERDAGVAHAALLELGRPDLAELVCFHQDDDGWLYLEPLDEVEPDDVELMARAERIALGACRHPSISVPGEPR